MRPSLQVNLSEVPVASFKTLRWSQPKSRKEVPVAPQSSFKLHGQSQPGFTTEVAPQNDFKLHG